MIGAIVRDDIVENVIIIKEAQVESMAAALNCEIVDASPYGLQAGDLRTAKGWTRNAGGEQMVLPLLEGKSYESYTLQQERIGELEERVTESDEILNIILGGETA